jgi:hypothetical protein
MTDSATDQPVDQERYIDKVMKLLAKAESTTPEEAEALLSKAVELMQRYAIDDAMLAASGKIDDEVITHRIKMKSSYLIGIMQLGFQLGHAFGFKVMQSKYRGEGTVYWVGWKSDIEKAEVILTSLMIQMERASRSYMKKQKDLFGYEWAELRPMDKHVMKRSFMIGFADESGTRVREANKRAQDEAAKGFGDQGSSSLLPVLASRHDQVEAYYADKHSNTKKGRATRSNYDSLAAGAGREAARNADIGTKRVGGSVRGEIR